MATNYKSHTIQGPGHYLLDDGQIALVTSLDMNTLIAHGKVLYSDTKTRWLIRSGMNVTGLFNIIARVFRDGDPTLPPDHRQIGRRELLAPTEPGTYKLRYGKMAVLTSIGELRNVGYLEPYKRKRYFWEKNGRSVERPGEYDIVNWDIPTNDNMTEFPIDEIRKFKVYGKLLDRSTGSILFVCEYPPHDRLPESERKVIIVETKPETDPVIYYSDILNWMYRIKLNDWGTRE